MMITKRCHLIATGLPARAIHPQAGHHLGSFRGSGRTLGGLARCLRWWCGASFLQLLQCRVHIESALLNYVKLSFSRLQIALFLGL